uniref:Uncharacterized protein n=1 Tax=Plectus sambesii TaxID=2011161 RepID=A0A914UJZ7_9BILA
MRSERRKTQRNCRISAALHRTAACTVVGGMAIRLTNCGGINSGRLSESERFSGRRGARYFLARAGDRAAPAVRSADGRHALSTMPPLRTLTIVPLQNAEQMDAVRADADFSQAINVVLPPIDESGAWFLVRPGNVARAERKGGNPRVLLCGWRKTCLHACRMSIDGQINTRDGLFAEPYWQRAPAPSRVAGRRLVLVLVVCPCRR